MIFLCSFMPGVFILLLFIFQSIIYAVPFSSPPNIINLITLGNPISVSYPLANKGLGAALKQNTQHEHAINSAPLPLSVYLTTSAVL